METYSYSASKAGLIMLTRHLGRRLAAGGEHITVNAVAPGRVLPHRGGVAGERGTGLRIRLGGR